MEEINGVTGTTTPVPEQPTGVEPVVPETTTPKPAEASQAAIDAASAPSQAPESQPEAAAAEQPQTPAEPAAPASEEIPVTDEMVELAIGYIKKNHRSSAARLQRGLNLPLATVEKLLDTLTAKGVLGPQEGTAPRKILIELPPKQSTPPPAPKQKKQTPAPEPKKDGKFQKTKMTDYDRKMKWKEHLREIGKYTDENFIEAMTNYALANPGYNPASKWGSCLIVMVNRLGNQLRDGLRTFAPADAEYIQKELARFFAEKPLGDCPQAWNTNFSTNGAQKGKINEFFGIDAPYRELRGTSRIVMTAVRNAAWPNAQEERNGTGGTFAERFHYLGIAMLKFILAGSDKALFENAYHSEPTENFLIKVNGGVPGQKFSAAPSWIGKDGKCKECGSDITTDSNGNKICSNFLCEHNIARTATDVAQSFRQKQPRRERPPMDGGFVPPLEGGAPAPQPERRRNWKDKKRHGDRQEGDGEFPTHKGPRNKGRRWRENQDGDIPEHISEGTGVGDGVTVSLTPGGENLGSLGNAFAGLKLQGQLATPEPEKTEELPPPPAEVPVPPATQDAPAEQAAPEAQ